MKIVIVAGDAKPEVVAAIEGILSNYEINPDYDCDFDLESLKEDHGSEAVLDAICHVYPDSESKLKDQANYFHHELLTNEYMYLVQRLIGVSDENDNW